MLSKLLMQLAQGVLLMFGDLMTQLSFDQIKAAIAEPKHKPSNDRLRIAEPPEPFVAPTFARTDGQATPLGEVILIRASAAVGKSTIARALSAARLVPILDLARTEVATGSLKGLLADLRNSTNPLEAFHAGELPIIVDALDEGRIKSSENSFVSFLDTSAETILESREATEKPKLILFGRPEAVEWAAAAFERDSIGVSVLDVGFFDQVGARALIHAYAQQAAKPGSGYLVHKEPADQLITTYFNKIEAALGLASGDLWTSDSGPSFAGYAPVLAAIGSLIPQIDNFAEALNDLNQAGSNRAWGVIESVLDAIIKREQGKLRALIEPGMSKALPPEAYDKEEQLTLLLQHVQGVPRTGTGRVQLTPSDMAKYDDEIGRWLPEHPFLRNGELSNDVIASFVLAPAIVADRPISQWDRLRSLARQPFLWRSLSSHLAPEVLIDGKYLGVILNSFWSDPLTQSDRVMIHGTEEGSALVSVRSKLASDAFVTFLAAPPIILHGQVRNAEVELDDDFILEGAGSDPSAFLIEDSIIRSTSPITLNAAKLKLAGQVWLDGDVLANGGQLSLDFAQGATYGWGSETKNKYPFSRHSPTLADPEQSSGGRLQDLLDECVRRFPPGSALALNPDYTPPERDPHTRWASRRFPTEFPLLIDVLIRHGFAEAEAMQASGSGKVRVRLNRSMEAIRDGISSGKGDFAAISSELKGAIE